MGAARVTTSRRWPLAGFRRSGGTPHYAPDGPRRPADVVNLGFVLNVIEDRHERAETLMAAYGFARRALSIAVMPLGKYTFDGLKPYGDGYVTARGTFQKYFAQQELRDFIAQATGEAPVAFAPGIFVVFRDKELEQEVLLKRQARALVRPLGLRPPERERRVVPARPELADRIRPELDTFGRRFWSAVGYSTWKSFRTGCMTASVPRKWRQPGPWKFAFQTRPIANSSRRRLPLAGKIS